MRAAEQRTIVAHGDNRGFDSETCQAPDGATEPQQTAYVSENGRNGENGVGFLSLLPELVNISDARSHS